MPIIMPSQIEDTPGVKLALLCEVAEMYTQYANDPRISPEKKAECLNILDDAIALITDACAGLQDYLGD